MVLGTDGCSIASVCCAAAAWSLPLELGLEGSRSLLVGPRGLEAGRGWNARRAGMGAGAKRGAQLRLPATVCGLAEVGNAI